MELKEKEFLAIGDIEGRYKTLTALLKKCPDVLPISLGDAQDRGPRSKEVLYFFMEHGKMVYSNHDDLMLDWIKSGGRGGKYDFGLWGGITNGAYSTIQSFGLTIHAEGNPRKLYEENKDLILWMQKNPIYMKGDGFILTHGIIEPGVPFECVIDINSSFDTLINSCIWNIYSPEERAGEFQIHGHLAKKEVYWYGSRQPNNSSPEGAWGVDIDTSRGKKLTAIHWPSKKIYEQEFLD